MERCFVYIQLPQTLETVVCGRFERERLSSGDYVGRFIYGRSYRARQNAVEIDPVHLPLLDRQYETLELKGIFGALRDAGPDSWGRRVIEHAMGRLDLGEVDYLLNSPHDRAGALSFGLNEVPPPPHRDFNKTLQLEQLLKAASELESLEFGAPLTPELTQLQQLVNTGTSMGGARPKNVVEDDSGLWLAKFPSKADRWNNAAVEAGMLSLASQCDIRTPPFRVENVGGAPVLLIQRFDRHKTGAPGKTDYFRSRMVSALTVLGGDETANRERWSYLDLSDEIRRWSEKPAMDRAELFRRMVLNALVTNNDDHPRNHALLANTAKWRLSPVYDITPSPVHSHERDLAMTSGIKSGRRATRANLLSGCARFGITAEDASEIIDRLRAIVAKNWEATVRHHGATQADCIAIQPAFAIPGFDD